MRFEKLSAHFLFVLLTAFMAVGCSINTERKIELKWVDGVEEIQAEVSFIEIGTTRKSVVQGKLGFPTTSFQDSDGGEALAYLWECPAWIQDPNGGDGESATFDPFLGETEEERTMHMASLFIRFDRHGFVRGYSIQGPENVSE